jgi:hypothetical protein
LAFDSPLINKVGLMKLGGGSSISLWGFNLICSQMRGGGGGLVVRVLISRMRGGGGCGGGVYFLVKKN